MHLRSMHSYPYRPLSVSWSVSQPVCQHVPFCRPKARGRTASGTRSTKQAIKSETTLSLISMPSPSQECRLIYRNSTHSTSSSHLQVQHIYSNSTSINPRKRSTTSSPLPSPLSNSMNIKHTPLKSGSNIPIQPHTSLIFSLEIPPPQPPSAPSFKLMRRCPRPSHFRFRAGCSARMRQGGVTLPSEGESRSIEVSPADTTSGSFMALTFNASIFDLELDFVEGCVKRARFDELQILKLLKLFWCVPRSS